MKRLFLLALSILLLGLSSFSYADTVSDDFSFFDTTIWTKYDAGSNNVNVNEIVPGAVYIDGARNFEPACRITHEMSTGTNDFYAQFDIKWTGGYYGVFRVGWSLTNDYALVQNHSDYSVITRWTDAAILGFGHGGRTWVGVRKDGLDTWQDVYDFSQNVWHTVVFKRDGNILTGQVWTQGKGTLLGEQSVELETIEDYEYFHISTFDNMMNSQHTYYNIDNLLLEVYTPPTPEQQLSELEDSIIALPEDAFKNNANNRKNALSKKIADVVATLDFANEETDPVLKNELYQEAINKLNNDIRAKADGCLGGQGNNDWITDCDAQININDQIDNIISSITGLMI